MLRATYHLLVCYVHTLLVGTTSKGTIHLYLLRALFTTDVGQCCGSELMTMVRQLKSAAMASSRSHRSGPAERQGHVTESQDHVTESQGHVTEGQGHVTDCGLAEASWRPKS